MRICHIIGTSKIIGGMERHVLDLSEQQAQNGNEVILICDNLIAQKCTSGVDCQIVNMKRGRHDPRLIWSIFRLLRILKPEIIHVHGRKAASAFLCAENFLKFPFHKIITVHNTRKDTKLFAHFDAVIAVSHAVGACLGNIPYHVIWNGVRYPTPENTPKIPPSSSEGKIVGVIGRLSPVKGIDVLLKAWKPVANQFPEAKLWIIGDGEERENLKQLATDLGINSQVWFAGYRTDCNDLLSQMDLVVIPSWREGFNYIFAEALLKKKPIIATDVADFAQFLSSEHIIESGQIEQLTKYISHALLNPQKFSLSMHNAWEKAEKNLSLEIMVQNTQKLYQQLQAR